jgi:hypothetical protein
MIRNTTDADIEMIIVRLCIHHRDFEVGETISGNIDNFLKKVLESSQYNVERLC